VGGFKPCERLLNKVGLVMGMDVGQNAHCLPWSDVEAPSETYRCAWVLGDLERECGRQTPTQKLQHQRLFDNRCAIDGRGAHSGEPNLTQLRPG